MTFDQALHPYIGADGTVSCVAGEKSDNPHLFGATELFVRRKLRLDTMEAKARFDRYLAARIGASGRWLPLPERSWGGANLSHDEVNGWATVSPEWAAYIYGHAHPGWVFNATGVKIDYLRGWYGRFPYLIPFIRALAGHDVSPFMQRLYAWELRRAQNARWQEPGIETSRRCLITIQSQWVDRMPSRMKDAMYEFLITTDRQFGSLGGLYSVYFKSGHPFAEYTRNVTLYPPGDRTLA